MSENPIVAFMTALLIVSLIGFSIWYEINVWQECRAHDTWWYCLRILG